MGSDDDSSSDNGPDLPAGVLRSRGGWDDTFNLEMEHQRERLRADEDERDNAGRGEKPSSTHAAVDLNQFRNEEVGKGYQAKHVVRQREATASASAAGVVDMSGGKFSSSKKERGAESAASKKRSLDDKGATDDGGGGEKKAGDFRLESYLQCKGMRDFMKDIDKILKQ